MQSTILSIVGFILGLIYFYQQHRLNIARLEFDLRKEFNSRFNTINDLLYDIINSNGPLSPTEIKTLNDYLDLCSEEFYYYKKGYVHRDLWNTWRNGMLFYFKNPRLSSHIVNELKNNDYHNLISVIS